MRDVCGKQLQLFTYVSFNMEQGQVKRRRGRFGPPYGWLEHEIANWIRARAGLELIPVPAVPRILRDPDVEELTRLCRSARFKMEKAGRFPKRVILTEPAQVAADARAGAEGNTGCA